MKVLAPEPIELVDDDSTSPANDGFAVVRAQVTDCTIVTGEEGCKFAVWKVTLVLQPHDDTRCRTTISLFKRYSQFRRLHDQLVQRCREAGLPAQLPQLPPRVSWYRSWRYQEANLDRSWLARRRQGLDYFVNKILLDQSLVNAHRELIEEFLER
ncbi:hypothetical protein HG537_0E00750 [Torulaspora globosa]|uniref:Endosomal/vacuolar adapter protein YPT35 n=1 Tax=Torulaspora globosa TaxID=48254 RepID=A0A7H9HWG8_9SACH|nr:hypothetical protein HG537_0E00750 [Torulaspora sp. CBS 2947]